MGLDQWSFAVKKGCITTAVDFDTDGLEQEEVQYWRKHPNLEGWMEALYYKKGGTKDMFNCATLLLTKEDFESLKKDVEDGKLPTTEGFFFGDSSDDYYKKETLEWIEKCFNLLRDGYDVYYSSWW